MNKHLLIVFLFLVGSIIPSFGQLREAASINSNEISIIEVAPSGLLWIGLKGGGCVKFDPTNGMTSFFNKTNSSLKTDSILAIDTRMIKGVLNVMMATNKGAVFQHAGIWDTVASLPDSKVNDIAVTTDGRILFATQDSGIAVYDTNFVFIKKYNKTLNPSMPSNRILKFNRRNIDCGTVYCATNNGVMKLDAANNISVINIVGSIIKSDSITCVSALSVCNGEMALGSEKGISKCSGISCINYDLGNGLSSEHVTVIDRDSAGTLWIGTRDSGIIIYDNINFTKITKVNGLPSNIITDINCLSSCACYVGTRDSGVFLVGCDKKVSKRLTISAINEAKLRATLNLYPQPANDQLHISLSDQIEKGNFQMFDYAGRVVKNVNFGGSKELTVEVIDLPQGFYTYMVSDKQGHYQGGKAVIGR